MIGVGFLTSPAAFVENVIRFPLGLTSVKSPAASPLLGQVLVTPSRTTAGSSSPCSS